MKYGLLYTCAVLDRLMFTLNCEAWSGTTAAENRRPGSTIIMKSLVLVHRLVKWSLFCLVNIFNLFLRTCVKLRSIKKKRDYLRHAVIAEQLAEGVRGVQSSFGTVRCQCKLASELIQNNFFFCLSDRFNFIFHLLILPSSPVLMLTSPLPAFTQVSLPPTVLPHDSLRGMLGRPGVIGETYTLGLDPSKV